MDYLDPKKKKLMRTRIVIGYFLIAIAISIGTVVLVFLANGFYVDRESGQVIQNGLIYVDTKPEPAEVYLNGQKQRGTTDARLVVPEGNHTIELRRTGYHPWQRSLQLEGGSLRRLTYARLVPETITTEQALVFPEKPVAFSQSIDKRWVVTSLPSSPLVLKVLDLEQPVLQLADIPLPVGIVPTVQKGVWEVIEWADDDKTFLAKYTVDNAVYFVLIDRTEPANAVNLTNVFASTPFSSIELRNRKNDQFIAYNATTKQLWRATITNPTPEILAEGVLQYKAFGDAAVLYITASETPNSVAVQLKVDDKTYKLRTLAVSDKYFLEMSKLGSAYVVGIGSAAENRVIVYNDPVKAVSEVGNEAMPVPTTVMRVDNPTALSISADSSVVLVHNGQQFATHEFEEDRSYTFQLETAIDQGQKIIWVDGQHFSYVQAGMYYFSDFDGGNVYPIAASDLTIGSFAEASIDLIYTVQSAVQPDTTTSYALVRSFMRTQADR